MLPELKTLKVTLGVATLLSFVITGFTVFTYELDTGTSEVTAIDSFTPARPLYPDVAGTVVFKNNCTSCHRLDETVIGPGLRHVYSRRDSVWLRSWIANSSKMIAEGDPTAVELFSTYKKTQMTNFSTMKKEDVDALMGFLKLVDKDN